MKIGFNNDKYLELQSKHIMERISKFDDKLYLEFGGKLFDDYHASRVLPGFKPDSKLQMLLQLKENAEIVFAICANHIDENKLRGDLKITYEQDVFRLINEFKNVGLYVSSVVITQYKSTKQIKSFEKKLKNRGINVYHHYYIEGYPTNTKKIISEDGFGKNDYIITTRPLVVVTAPGPGSGKMATCLSQLYHEHLHGVNAGYAKYETFPIWNLALNHPVNLAYEAATADLADVNMIDPYHLQAYNKVTVNYNRDVEIYPVLRNIFEEINGSCPYESPTDMGVNMAGFAIEDDEACCEASKQEIIRRYYETTTRFAREKCGYEEVHKQELIMKNAHISNLDRKCVQAEKDKETRVKVYSGALELHDGTIITGKNSKFMGVCSALLINATKYLAKIDDGKHIISSEAFEPIQQLKTEYLGSQNPRLHSDEILVALAMSARNNEDAAKAMSMLKCLKGVQGHVTCDVGDVDANIYSHLGIQLTFEANKR